MASVLSFDRKTDPDVMVAGINCNDGLLAITENFVKDHFLPTTFVDYRRSVQQAISSPAAFRPRANAAASYTPSIEKGRPVLQGLLAIDFLAIEVLGWAQAMPKFADDLINYVQTFLERAYERCRTSYMEVRSSYRAGDFHLTFIHTI